MKKREIFKVEGDKIVRLRRNCPKCGDGVFLAEHKDRLSCGTCGYTEFKGRKEKPAEKPEEKAVPKEEVGEKAEGEEKPVEEKPERKVGEKPAEKTEEKITESQEVSTEKPTSEEQPAEPEKSTEQQ